MKLLCVFAVMACALTASSGWHKTTKAELDKEISAQRALMEKLGMVGDPSCTLGMASGELGPGKFLELMEEEPCAITNGKEFDWLTTMHRRNGRICVVTGVQEMALADKTRVGQGMPQVNLLTTLCDAGKLKQWKPGDRNDAEAARRYADKVIQ